MSGERSTLQGDGPCDICGGPNLVWFTDNVFWNAVRRQDDGGPDGILCIRCFVERAELAGYRPTAWRVLPSWEWTIVYEKEGTP